MAFPRSAMVYLEDQVERRVLAEWVIHWPLATSMIRASLPLPMKLLGGPTTPYGGLLMGNLKCPFKSHTCKKRGASAISPLEKAGHLSSSILYAHCFHYLTKYSFPSALLLFLPPNYRSYSLEPAPSHAIQTACSHLPPFPPVVDNVLTPSHPKTLPFNLGSPQHTGQLLWLLDPTLNSSSSCPLHVLIPLRVLISNKVERGVSGSCRTFKKYL